MFDFIRKSILLGTGLAHFTAEKIDEAAQEFVNRENWTAKEGREVAEDLRAYSQRVKKEFAEKVEKVIHENMPNLRFPTRQELEEIKTRLEELERLTGKKA